MRVISGKYKGKYIEGFDIDGTRPTKDRVKESIFGSIQNKVRNSIFLDLFSGSGSIGIEALSNGASKCYFVENGKDIYKILVNNLADIDCSYIVQDDYLNALKQFSKKGIKFDIIYIDPPYDSEFAINAIKIIISKELIDDESTIIIETDDEERITKQLENSKLEIVDRRKYGRAVLIFSKIRKG